MMDKATQVDGVWIIRPLRDAELECIETMSAVLANIITPIAMLPASNEIIGFSGPGASQWDLNVDMLCRRLNRKCIAFIQPNWWEKLEFYKEKRILATANNTQIVIDAFRRCLRQSFYDSTANVSVFGYGNLKIATSLASITGYHTIKRPQVTS